ncbi:MAG: hypothetical protein ATN36_08660 [Epulopiscium sp. Nele67-Bin005]|nr:MAG: hypothetical protein ATN36_08660 [Epulopiscium sp. Nele67-Bin005]
MAYSFTEFYEEVNPQPKKSTSKNTQNNSTKPSTNPTFGFTDTFLEDEEDDDFTFWIVLVGIGFFILYGSTLFTSFSFSINILILLIVAYFLTSNKVALT